jgi:response regulator NasT
MGTEQAMTPDQLTQQIDLFRQRMATLRPLVVGAAGAEADQAVQTLGDLAAALEELRVAEEELRQQNEELAAARQALEAQQQRYRDLFEFAPDAYLVTDAAGRIEEANRAASGLLNVALPFLTGKPHRGGARRPHRRRRRARAGDGDPDHLATRCTMSQPLRIAVADDEADMREYLNEMLPRWGYEVVGVARTGRGLVEHCRTSRPDLVISDIKMPDMDGLEAARQVCADRLTPVIVVSAYHNAELVSRALDTPVLGYLVKPVKQVDLEVAVPLAMRRFQEMRGVAREADDLRRALEDRKVIERAKGVVMKRMGLAEDEVFRRLRKLACDQNRKLVEVAQSVLTAEQVFQALEER